MTPFSEDRSDCFFGRNDEVEHLLQRLRHNRFLAVIGPSGSGKSSLVSAGFVPALRASRLFGPGAWIVRRMRPGERPLATLARAVPSDLADPAAAVTTVLSEEPPGSRLLLFVDQLEELFTAAAAGRKDFEEALTRLAGVPECYVIVTVRADFYPELMTSPLWPTVSAHRFEVLPLRGDRLREAIVKPAEQVGVFVEAALVERLLADAADEPGLLPLVQETMVCLWERLERRLLPLRAYDTLVLPHRAYGGPQPTGLEVALARQADATMAQLEPARQALARRILLRLVQFGEGRSDVRRQQLESALRTAGDDPQEFDAVLEHLASRRLLTLGGDGDGDDGGGGRRVDISHETLITGWPTFRTWLDERREAEQTRRGLAAKAAEWTRLGGDAGGLLDQVELLEAERWLASPHSPELGVDSTILELVTASRQSLEETAREREAVRQRELEQARALAAEQERRADLERQRADEQVRARRSLARRAQALAVLALVMVVVAAFATVQRQRADREARVASSRALAVQARLLADERLDLALLLGREAYRISPTVEARGSLFTTLERHPRLTTFLHGHTEQAGPAVFSLDGRLVASGGDDDRIIIWDATTGRRVRDLTGHTDDVRAVVFSPDGRLLVTSGHDTTVMVWDVVSGTRVDAPFTAHTDRVRSLAITADGATVASAGVDRQILLWDLQSRQVAATLVQNSEVNSIAFSPDGTALAAASDDGRVVLWDVASRRERAVLSGHRDLVRSIAFSPDGRLLASGSNDRRVLLWDVASAAAVGELTGHVERVFSVAFSPDGNVLASGGRDRTVILWDVASHRPLGAPLTGHADSVRSVAFRRDGTLVTASDDRSVALWRLDNQHRLAKPLPHDGSPIAAMSATRDGGVVATASVERLVSVWDVARGARRDEPLDAAEAVTSVALSGDGRRVAAGTARGGVVVWDVASRARVLEAGGDGTAPTLAVALDGPGRTLAAGGQDRVIRRWSLADRRLRGEPIAGPAEWISVALSADGRRLAAGGLDGRLWLWDDAAASRPRGRVLSCPAGPAERLCGRPVQAVAFSPDGGLLVSGSSDNAVSLWDTNDGGDTGRPRRRLNGHTRALRAVAFSHDGRTVASAGDDQAVILWDTATGQRLGDALAGHDDSVGGVAFGPGDRSIVTGGNDGALVVWDIDLDSWRALACRVANRDLTPEEWNLYVGRGRHRPTCPGE